jgi:hypothetical protein
VLHRSHLLTPSLVVELYDREHRRANLSLYKLRGVLDVRSELVVPADDAKSCKHTEISPTLVGVIGQNCSDSDFQRIRSRVSTRIFALSDFVFRDLAHNA